jgi:hypothetical protein
MSPDALGVLASSVASPEEVTSLVFLSKLALAYQAWKKDKRPPMKKMERKGSSESE